MRHTRAIGLFLLVGFVVFPDARGQRLTRFAMEGQTSWILPHSEELVPISQSHPQGIRLSYEKLSLEKSTWENCNCFYLWGGELGYTNFNNPTVLGDAFFFSGFFEPVLWRRADWQLRLKATLGMTYLTKVYDVNSNPKNTFFSSPLSFLLAVAPKVSYQVSENWEVFLSGYYNHISNGGQRQPNRGMNFPGFGLGVGYWLEQPVFPAHKKPVLRHRLSFLLESFGTFRDNPADTGRVPALGISMDLIHTLTRINQLGLGTELSWDQSLSSRAETQGFVPAAFLSHHLVFGRVDFSQRMGLYLTDPALIGQNHRFFQRYALSYWFPTGFVLGVDLKAHGHVAENIGLRLGWLF
ncbi:acyloxyacyl hydrolase [Cyclobacterium xiamenense]|uniref:acyloxyacyl hydrolase n=1 Tax=Cyclobacterium xiamenense TaxID=1297121 RepID=UPI0012B75954|nr:acyloxyacyl hydrolase [Cyclobacterium xiamenense]